MLVAIAAVGIHLVVEQALAGILLALAVVVGIAAALVLAGIHLA